MQNGSELHSFYQQVDDIMVTKLQAEKDGSEMFPENSAHLPDDSWKRLPTEGVEVVLSCKARDMNRFGRVLAKSKNSIT